MFTKISTAALLAAALSACQSPAPRVGNDADAHGCRASAGETFSQLRQRCVRVFDVADIRLPDPIMLRWRRMRCCRTTTKRRSYFGRSCRSRCCWMWQKGDFCPRMGQFG